MLAETDRTVVHSVLLQSIPVLRVPLQAEQPQAELAAPAAQVQRLAARHRVALAELAVTPIVAHELQVAHQELAAVQTAVQVLPVVTAAMSSQEMAEMPRVIRAAQEEIAETLYSLVVAEDQVLTVLKQVVRK